MANAVIAYWSCALYADWYQLTMEARIESLEAAVRNAQCAGLAKNPDVAPNTIRTIFVAPEYAFTKECVTEEDNAIKKGALQTNTAGYNLLVESVKKLGLAYPDVLLVPGTIAYASGTSARNRCLVAHGNVKGFFDKKEPVGEVVDGDGLTFVPGKGCASYQEASGNHFLMHICKDATVEPESGAPWTDIHIVVGRGVGKEAIRPRARKILIVADAYHSQVYDYRTHQDVPLSFTTKVRGCELRFYVATM